MEELLHPKLIQLKEALWANEQSLLELKQRSDAETHPEAALEENLRRITQTLNSAGGGDEVGSVSVEEIEKAVEEIKSRMAHLEELQERVADTYEDLERRAEAAGKSNGDVDAAAGEAESSDDFLSVDEAKKIIQDAIEKFRTDGVGLSDFALATLGKVDANCKGGMLSFGRSNGGAAVWTDLIFLRCAKRSWNDAGAGSRLFLFPLP